MTRYRVQFHNVQDVIGFVDVVNKLDSACEIISGPYRVNAKSLMAVLSIPLAYVMTFEIAGSAELPEQMKKYIL